MLAVPRDSRSCAVSESWLGEWDFPWELLSENKYSGATSLCLIQCCDKADHQNNTVALVFFTFLNLPLIWCSQLLEGYRFIFLWQVTHWVLNKPVLTAHTKWGAWHGSGGLAKRENGGMSLKGRPVLGLDGQERRQASVPTEVEQKACQRARLKSDLQQWLRPVLGGYASRKEFNNRKRHWYKQAVKYLNPPLRCYFWHS